MKQPPTRQQHPPPRDHQFVPIHTSAQPALGSQSQNSGHHSLHWLAISPLSWPACHIPFSPSQFTQQRYGLESSARPHPRRLCSFSLESGLSGDRDPPPYPHHLAYSWQTCPDASRQQRTGKCTPLRSHFIEPDAWLTPS